MVDSMSFSVRSFLIGLIAGIIGLYANAQPVPFDAALNSITSHPSEATVLYGASVGGVLRSDDAGATWVQKPMFPLGQQQPFVQEVLFDNGNPSTIYAYATVCWQIRWSALGDPTIAARHGSG